VGGDGEPICYQFESPLLRLHLDEEYQILVQGGQLVYLDSHETVPPDSILPPEALTIGLSRMIPA
jgi:hypothetical protein